MSTLRNKSSERAFATYPLTDSKMAWAHVFQEALTLDDAIISYPPSKFSQVEYIMIFKIWKSYFTSSCIFLGHDIALDANGWLLKIYKTDMYHKQRWCPLFDQVALHHTPLSFCVRFMWFSLGELTLGLFMVCM